MTIKLANGSELNPIQCVGGPRYLQGANRDALTFIFPAKTSLDELDQLFTAEACEAITIVDNNGAEHIHNGYTLRAELKREPVEVAAATESAEAVYEDRVMVTMAQRTYMETRMAQLEALYKQITG